jgi:beta-lactamase regulating signal transducer with metallopeptidase domain
MSDLVSLQSVLVVVEAVAASVILPPMAWLLAKTYRKSAAARRLVWIGAFAMLLGLPLLALVAPSLAVIALPAPAYAPVTEPIAAPVVAADPGPRGFTWFDLIPVAVAVWLAGLAKLGLQHLFALVRLELMRRGATPWRMPTPVPVRGCDLLISEDCPGPITWGVIRPVIMLPDEALDWSVAKLATVLRHELAHVRRRDGLAQALAVTACALYWPNPLVWKAAKALRREAELAADDTVLAAGVLPSDYAGQLLELASEWRERRLTPTGLAMAAPPALSQRVQSILSTDPIRTGVTPMDAFKLVLLGGAATAALTLARPSVAEVPAPPAPAQQVELGGAAPLRPAPEAGPQTVPLNGAPLASSATGEPPGRPGEVKSVRHDGKVYQFTLAHDGKESSGGAVQLAQQAVPAPPATATPSAITSQPIPPLPPSAAAPPAPPAPPLIPGGPGALVPYNPVTDDPASPGYIAPGQPGAQHPVPANLAKLLNQRKDPGAAWTLQWLPSAPNGPPGSARFNIIGGRLTPEQRADLDRKLAAIGPAIDKAIKDAHIDETVQRALSAQDAKTREEVARRLQEIGPRIQREVANAQLGLRFAQLQPFDQKQIQEMQQRAQEMQAQAEERAATQLEEQAKRARERAQRARDRAKELQQTPQPAPAPKT